MLPWETEEFISPMTRKLIAFAAAALLLCAGLSCAFAEEKKTPATPTDLDCLHEHTKTTIYFYDSPAYSALNAEYHRVSGPADVVTVCEDCGEQLSFETADNAEEIRFHVLKKGVCLLCGYRLKVQAAEKNAEDEPGELTVYVQQDEDEPDFLVRTLSARDLAGYEKDGIATLIVRGETGNAAVALEVSEVKRQAEQANADLFLQFAEKEDGSFFAGIFFKAGPDERVKPEGGAFLRFYREAKADVRISLAPAETEELVEIPGEWNEKGYWTVPYSEEGTYFLLQ